MDSDLSLSRGGFEQRRAAHPVTAATTSRLILARAVGVVYWTWDQYDAIFRPDNCLTADNLR